MQFKRKICERLKGQISSLKSFQEEVTEMFSNVPDEE